MGGTDSRRRDDGENRGWKADIGPGAGENGEKTTPNTTFRQCCCFGKVRGVTPTGGDKVRTWLVRGVGRSGATQKKNTHKKNGRREKKIYTSEH